MMPDLNAPTVLPALTRWLQRQPGYGIGHLDRVRVVAAPLLVNRLPAGGPSGLLAVVQAARRDESTPCWYLVPLGLRSGPPRLAPEHVVHHFDGGCLYDATRDEELMWLALAVFAGAVTAAANDRPRITVADRPRPGTGGPACTPVLVDDTHVLKWYRRVHPGGHPGLELHRALHTLGNAHVSALHASLETDVQGNVVTFAALQSVPPGRAAQEAAAGSARAAIAGEEPGADFTATATRLGACVARVHADLFAAFGGDRLTPFELRHIATGMTRRAHEVPVAVPRLRPYRSRLLAALAEVATPGESVVAQRVHSDLSLGNILLTGDGPVVDLDWVRSAPEQHRKHPVARDLAGVLRAFERTVREQLAGTTGDAVARRRAGTWFARCRRSFLAGYADAGGRVHDRVLRAYELDWAVRELVAAADPAPADVAAVCRILDGADAALPRQAVSTRSRSSRRTGPANWRTAPATPFSAAW